MGHPVYIYIYIYIYIVGRRPPARSPTDIVKWYWFFWKKYILYRFYSFPRHPRGTVEKYMYKYIFFNLSYKLFILKIFYIYLFLIYRVYLFDINVILGVCYRMNLSLGYFDYIDVGICRSSRGSSTCKKWKILTMCVCLTFRWVMSPSSESLIKI